MAYQITSESYGRRLPKITATADSTDDLATLGTDWAEGSTCVIGSTTYSLDKVQGWVEPGSGGGGGMFIVKFTSNDNGTTYTADKTFEEVLAASKGPNPIIGYEVADDGGFVTTPFIRAIKDTIHDPPEWGMAYFQSIEVIGTDSYMNVYDFTINLDDTVTRETTEWELTPRT